MSSFRFSFRIKILIRNEMSIRHHVNKGQDFILEWKVRPGELRPNNACVFSLVFAILKFSVNILNTLRTTIVV